MEAGGDEYQDVRGRETLAVDTRAMVHAPVHPVLLSACRCY